jgi:hypothetical protein
MRFDVCSFLVLATKVTHDKPLVANLRHSLTKGDRQLSADPLLTNMLITSPSRDNVHSMESLYHP